MWLPDRPTEKPKSHIMMVVALSGSDLADSACRDSKAWQFRAARSIGLFLLGFTELKACRRLVAGAFLHSASRAKPNEVSASPYMTCSPAFATEKPNSHMTVLMASGRGAFAPARTGPFASASDGDCAVSCDPTISFSYLSQLSVARLSWAAGLGGASEQATAIDIGSRAGNLMTSPSRRQQTVDQRREAAALDPALRRLDVRGEIAVGGIVRDLAPDVGMNAFQQRRRARRPVKVDALGCREHLDSDDTGNVVHQRAQAPCGMSGHAHMILLIRRGRYGIHAAGSGEGLVLRRERGRGHLRDHEARVEAAVLHQKRRQSAHLGIDEHRHAALRQVADLGQRQ